MSESQPFEGIFKEEDLQTIFELYQRVKHVLPNMCQLRLDVGSQFRRSELPIEMRITIFRTRADGRTHAYGFAVSKEVWASDPRNALEALEYGISRHREEYV